MWKTLLGERCLTVRETACTQDTPESYYYLAGDILALAGFATWDSIIAHFIASQFLLRTQISPSLHCTSVFLYECVPLSPDYKVY